MKITYPDDVTAIHMITFITGGSMERVHHMKITTSLMTQWINRYKDDVAEILR